ncbi:MAG: ATP-binding cassette domain-containing protein [Akkermansiaceae bacterium]|nr:ATP-binding cassette domain-containing protein [Akkermansiaceae bacterium]
MLELKNIKKTFHKGRESVIAVDGVSLKAESGEILGLVGESGCGKSTISRIIMQLLMPDEGSVKLGGVDLTALPRKQIRRHRLDFQMVFQDPYASLNPRLTVFSTIGEALQQRDPRLRGEALRKRVGELLETVGLPAKQMQRYPHEFSGGQRQRIAIARALAPEPRIIIADEPVSALDVSIQSQILNLLRRLQKDLGLTMLFISHDLSVVHYLADRIAVMHKGKIVEHGDADQIFHEPKEDYTQKLLSSVPKLPVRSE